jgi:uncharacterized phage protein (TIGR01671 family)
MDREIKFRAWNNSLKQMTSSINLYDPIYNFDWLGLYDFPIMQYTGVKDRNGKEVYEGDIVNIHLPNEQIITAEIVWEYCCTVLRMDKRADIAFTEAEKECQGRQIPFQEILEVIGNIHENPDL